MTLKSVWLAGLLVFGAGAVNAQQYWSTNASLDCGATFGDQTAAVPGTPYAVTGGYVCKAIGTLPWYAAGREWRSSIRISAPPTAPINVTLDFYDVNYAEAALDFRYQGDPTVHNDSTAGGALYANQPLEVDLLGLKQEAPSYGVTSANGSVVVYVDCPDQNTCAQVQAQLIYSALPSFPWSLSAPVVWDQFTSNRWSSVAIDDGTTNKVSFVIYNFPSDTSARTYKLNVYDSTGNLYSTGTTASVESGGTYGKLLREVVPNLPSGPFKLQLVTSGTDYTAFEVLQFNGTSGTTLVVADEYSSTPMPAGAMALKGERRAPARRLSRLQPGAAR
jgi:hypothetical protein